MRQRRSRPPLLQVGVTNDRITHVSPAARTVHRAILRSFATTGRPPTRDTLATTATGHNLDLLLQELHNRDVIRLDDHGAIRAAYPFSAQPTPHTVELANGPTVYAMCAIDALGIADMLDRDVVIRSTDPHNGRPITVTIHNGQTRWEPGTAIVYSGVTTTAPPADRCQPARAGTVPSSPVPAEDRCCTVMNFFTDPTNAHAWLAAHPDVSGTILDQTQALQMGIDIFGQLLNEGTSIGGVGPCVAQVLGDAGMEQEGVLEHHAQLPGQRGEGDLA